jgi:hypothetical protein
VVIFITVLENMDYLPYNNKTNVDNFVNFIYSSLTLFSFLKVQHYFNQQICYLLSVLKTMNIQLNICTVYNIALDNL